MWFGRTRVYGFWTEVFFIVERGMEGYVMGGEAVWKGGWGCVVGVEGWMWGVGGDGWGKGGDCKCDEEWVCGVGWLYILPLLPFPSPSIDQPPLNIHDLNKK